MIDLATAAEVFCRGFSFQRSISHPYLVGRCGRLLYMHDAPRKRDYRKAEIVAPNLPPEEVLEGVATIRAQHPEATSRYALCAISPGERPDEQTKRIYKATGYRLWTTEPMMVANPATARPVESSARLWRVQDLDGAELVRQAADGKHKIRPDQIEGDQIRLYAASVDDLPIGWVRSIRTSQDTAWVADLFVKEEHRRKGIAKGLMARLLQEDHEHGIKTSVLLASHTGAMLYPSVGYQQIGTLHLFTPRRTAGN